MGVIERWLPLAPIHLYFIRKNTSNQVLFMLVSALMGTDRMQAAYAHAIGNGYRFYSYGDSSLLLP